MENPLNRSWALLIGVTLGVLLVAIIPVHAAPVPDGLTPGDPYRLAFVTREPIVASRSNIADYDAFVTSEAAPLDAQLVGQNVTWSAMVSTAFNPEVMYNTDTFIGDGGAPIYNTNGELIASDNFDLWDAQLAAPIMYDQTGDEWLTEVWTGFMPLGLPLFPLGSGGFSNWGNSFDTDPGWAEIFIGDDRDLRPVYAISSTLEVVPVPAAIWLFGSGLVALLGLRKKGIKA